MRNPDLTRAELTCPACGFSPLLKPSWIRRQPSYEICPCCRMQFGYRDFTYDVVRREEIHRRWRQEWIHAGMVWWLKDEAPPSDWDPVEQLAWLSSLDEDRRSQSDSSE